MKMLFALSTILTLTACSGFRAAPGALILGSTTSTGLVVTNPSASIAAPATGMVGVAVEVTVSSAATLMNPRWDFGDGSAVTTETKHIYNQVGTYTIRLTTDDLTTTRDIQIVAYSDQGASCINQLALGLPATAVVGRDLPFALTVPSCLSGMITNVTWDFDDGSTVTGFEVTHAFTALDTYDIEVTIDGALGQIHLQSSLKVVSADITTPTDPRNPGDEPANTVVPPAAKGGWNPVDASLCYGIAEINGRVDCVSYAYCSGTSCGALDGAVATCRYTYLQGPNDWRLRPGAWEWWSENMDHPATGWGCAVTGIEPRLNSAVFNADYYMKTNPDVKAAMGPYELVPDAAKRHWLTYGIFEGRRASGAFSAKAYLARYADLRANMGATNYSQATIHYVTFGIKEGRNGLP